MTEPNIDILTNPVSWVFLLFVVALAAVPLWTGGRMLRGTVRHWTLAPKIPFQIPDRNTWPFILVSFGLAISIAILSIPFEIAGWEHGRQFIWNGPFWIPWVGVALGVFYWPLALTPRWYKRWVNHEDYPDVSPWRPEEVRAVLTRPADKKRDRMIRDMGWCGIDVKAAWSEAGLPGEPPEEWWAKATRQGDQKYADMGITEDMDAFQRADIIRACAPPEGQSRQESRPLDPPRLTDGLGTKASARRLAETEAAAETGPREQLGRRRPGLRRPAESPGSRSAPDPGGRWPIGCAS